MIRIGFAYNLKPESSAPSGVSGREILQTEEPPSRWRDDDVSRASESLAPSTASAVLATPIPSDEFAEWDTPETIGAVTNALAALGEVVPLEATPDFPERLRAEQPTLVFNIAEGGKGANRESHVPAICEFFGIPYSGSDPFTLSLCLDKARTKETLAANDVATAPFALVRSASDLPRLHRRIHARTPSARDEARALSGRPLRLPLFVKPVHEGSSKGITEQNYCETIDALDTQVQLLLERYRQPVLVEQYLPGAEFTCAVLGNGTGATVLPIVGMEFGSLPTGALPIYGFEAKWVWDRSDQPLDIFQCPARIDPALRQAIEEITLNTYHVLGCRDWARIDVRLDAEGTPNIVEVNPLPGILPDPADNSCFPKAARSAGLSYDALIQTCAILAAERQGISLPRRGLTPAIAAALRLS